VSGDTPDRVIRATELVGQPVVTLGGDDLAEVRDVVYDADQGALLGFTLNKRGWFRGRLHERLPVASVHAIGRDAVMVSSDNDLVAPDDAPAQVADPPPERNVLGAAVLTDDGARLGAVSDVIVALGPGALAVGYEVSVDSNDTRHARYVPLPEQMAVSGDALIVPHEVDAFIRDDLAGFGAAVEDFRAQLHQEHQQEGGSG
jgi:uncharacterized protein YrrD